MSPSKLPTPLLQLRPAASKLPSCCCRRYQLAPLVLSLVLAALFKRARLNGFVELDKLRRQLYAAQAVALATSSSNDFLA